MTRKIQSIRTRMVSIPLERPLITATFPITAIDTVLVDVHTNDGLSGLGWVFAFGRGRVRGIQSMIDDIGALIVGEDAGQIERCLQKMRNACTFIGHTGAAVIAISPLETALWDIAGKAAGMPLAQLLGGHKSAIEVYASEGLWLNQSIDELQKQAAGFIARGFTAMKMRAGKANVDEDLARVAAVREAIGPDAKLMVDANQAWDVPTALRFARGCEESQLLWLEEPVYYQDYAGMARIASESTTPLCVGETNYAIEDFRRLCQEGCGHYIMPDLMRTAGISNWMKVAHLAEAFQLPVTPHLFMEVSSHQACALPNAVWQEHQPWWEPIWKEPVDFRDGKIHIRERPGLGVEWDENAVNRYLV